MVYYINFSLERKFSLIITKLIFFDKLNNMQLLTIELVCPETETCSVKNYTLPRIHNIRYS